jgi:hypothetical protein
MSASVSGFTIRHSVEGTACPLEPWRTLPPIVMWLIGLISVMP